MRKSEEPEFTGSIYHVIPAQVFDDERLSPNEKLFYGLISGLTHRNGYCYSKDKYFAERMKCELRIVQEWLLTLERYGYIRRETKKVGMFWERKIFLSHSYTSSNKSYETKNGAVSNSTPSSKNLRLDTAPKCEQNIEVKNIEKKEEEEERATPQELSQAQKNLKDFKKRKPDERIRNEKAWMRKDIKLQREEKVNDSKLKAEQNCSLQEKKARAERVVAEWHRDKNSWAPLEILTEQGILWGRFKDVTQEILPDLPEEKWEKEVQKWKK